MQFFRPKGFRNDFKLINLCFKQNYIKALLPRGTSIEAMCLPRWNCTMFSMTPSPPPPRRWRVSWISVLRVRDRESRTWRRLFCRSATYPRRTRWTLNQWVNQCRPSQWNHVQLRHSHTYSYFASCIFMHCWEFLKLVCWEGKCMLKNDWFLMLFSGFNKYFIHKSDWQSAGTDHFG